MRMEKAQLTERIAVAAKQQVADVVVKNGKIIDVFNMEIIEGDIAIVDGMIVGIGKYEGNQVIDAEGRYISPGLIDAHVHIESSMVTPPEFSKVVLSHGVTTVITDPHEIANVAGVKGIDFMLESSENIPLDVYIMLPSCVPATPFEHSGAVIKAEDLERFFNHPRVLGLAEVMDFLSVQKAEDVIIDKLITTMKYTANIDGHAAGLNADAINVYRTSGIRTDHECVTKDEALDRVRRGMYVMLREGTVAKNLLALLPAVNEKNSRRFVFCTDDKHLDELLEEGSIDHHIRLSIQQGLNPLTAVQIATVNAAECYGLSDRGAIAPGYQADFLLIDDLNDFTISQVYKLGKLVAEEASPLNQEITIAPDLMNSINMKHVHLQDLVIKMKNTNQAHIIGINPNSLVTNKLVEEVTVEDGVFKASIEHDQLKMAVFERHHQTGNIGLGIVKGFEIKDGALAMTVAHDSHNLVSVSTNDEDMLTAVAAIKQMNGGIVVVQHRQVIASLELPIAGLISNEGYKTVNEKIKKLVKGLASIGATNTFNPLVTLSFLCLPVIPELKLTDNGLFDFHEFSHIPIEF
jgi:adenine deaminase